MTDAILAVVLAHLALHSVLFLATYLLPVRRFASGRGYRFWTPGDRVGRSQAVRSVALEFAVSYFFSVTYPLGWIWPSRSILRRGDGTRNDRTEPVILLHGYMMNGFCMLPLRRFLRRRGFARLYSLNLKHLFGPIESFCDQLRRRVHEVSAENGNVPVSIVGHSMGGIVGAAILSEPETAGKIKRIITIGTPFRGTILSYFGPGACGKQLRPDSPFLRRIRTGFPDETDGSPDAKKLNAKVVSIFTVHDRLVLPPESSAIQPFQAVRLDGLGHLSLLTSPTVFRLIEGHLLDFQNDPGLAENEPAPLELARLEEAHP